MYSQTNIEELFQLIGSRPNQLYRQTKNFDFIQSKDAVWPNQLFNLKTNCIEELKVTLNAIEQNAASGAIPSLYMSNPASDHEALIEYLCKRQYRQSSWTAMSHDLECLQPEEKIPNFSVQLVNSNEELSDWLHIVETELMANDKLNHDVFKALISEARCTLFLGFKSGIPVSTALLFEGSNSAGIYLVATSRAARKKGYGTWITGHCLQKARELNCQRVDIQATDDGLPIYQKLGFKAHGKIHVFRIEK